MSFGEFLEFKNQNKLKRLLGVTNLPPRIREDLNHLFEEYLIFGGYPKVALYQTKEEKISVLESIFTAYVRRDIKDLATIETEKFNRLLALLAFQVGNLINLSELSSATGLHRKTLEKYLFLLENTFIISLLKPYFTNRRQEIIKRPKLYFQDTGLRNYLVDNFLPLEKRGDRGLLWENALWTILAKKEKRPERLRFWRRVFKNEVDFVRIEKGNQLVPYESRLRVNRPRLPAGLVAFIKTYQPKKPLLPIKTWKLKNSSKKQKSSFFLLGDFYDQTKDQLVLFFGNRGGSDYPSSRSNQQSFLLKIWLFCLAPTLGWQRPCRLSS